MKKVYSLWIMPQATKRKDGDVDVDVYKVKKKGGIEKKKTKKIMTRKNLL